MTIVRPSHTYDERNIPIGVHGKNGFWQVIKRMQEGKPVIIQGDGSSLWTLTWNGDFAIGYTGLMGNRHAIGEAFQITSDETLTWDQIYQTIADALGKELHAVHVSSEFLAAAGDPLGFDFEGSLDRRQGGVGGVFQQKAEEACAGYADDCSVPSGRSYCAGLYSCASGMPEGGSGI